VLETLDAAAVRRWCEAGLEGLAGAREEIDALNVYPVPDGDTGTNLYLTVEAAHEAMAELPTDADLATTVSALAHGALMGARGNSGVILSQLLRGMAGTLSDPRDADAHVLVQALARAADLAYTAVARPVEGTMLTVARAAADGAARARDLAGVATGAAEAAREALAHTPEQLEVLRRAGVVDAGGRGLCVLYDALAGVVSGHLPVPARKGPLPVVDRRGAADACAGGPSYEVMYLLDAPDDAVDTLRELLAPLGESLVVVGGEGLWNVHVHVDDVGAAIEAGLEVGRPHQVRVTSFAETAGGHSHAAHSRPARARAVVSVVAGDGLAELFEKAGATVVRGGPGRRASTAELLEGVRRSGAGEVVVLPNDKSSLGVAEAAARQARKQGLAISVIPTVATVQALAALAVHDPGRAFPEDVVAMTAAAGHCRHGGVTVAARDAVTMAGPCRTGDKLGIVEGDFAVVCGDLADAARRVVDLMLPGGGELVTLVTGEDADPDLAPAVVEHIERTRPGVDTVVYAGGQPRYPLLIGVE
jgi:DAK2 domain fusion protein YloV